jgi:hypothetical protein
MTPSIESVYLCHREDVRKRCIYNNEKDQSVDVLWRMLIIVQTNVKNTDENAKKLDMFI